MRKEVIDDSRGRQPVAGRMVLHDEKMGRRVEVLSTILDRLLSSWIRGRPKLIDYQAVYKLEWEGEVKAEKINVSSTQM